MVPVPLPDLIVCLFPEPRPSPSSMVKPPTLSLIASETADTLSVCIVASIRFIFISFLVLFKKDHMFLFKFYDTIE
jgi:hypothetical protein